MTSIKIGTRGSLLAVTQCSQVKDQLEKLTNEKFELVKVKTEGDLNTSAPLWQMDGKDFFTKELDQALLSDKVDMVVHSYKDLGSERPDGIFLGAITKRTFAHDILLIKKETVSKLKEKSISGDLIVGTSSPRRICNIEAGLKNCLPFGKEQNINVKTKVLRGNVNSRIEKLNNDEYHAIVLAWAGLERLALGGDSRKTLEELVQGLNFMILPQEKFPSAASQGALGIECRGNDERMKNILEKIHHLPTAEAVSKEREIFASYGGGCHLAVGIHCEKTPDFSVVYERGKVDEARIEKRKIHRKENLIQRPNQIFAGFTNQGIRGMGFEFQAMGDEIVQKNSVVTSEEKLKGNFLIASQRAEEQFSKSFSEGSVWAAGSKTMTALAEKGHWVNGCCGVDGEEDVLAYLNSELVKIFFPNLKNYVLTNKDSKSSFGEIIVGYERTVKEPSSEIKNKIKDVEAFFWTSVFQFETYHKYFPEIKDKIHACGYGKTYSELKQAGIEVIPFASVKDFFSWQ